MVDLTQAKIATRLPAADLDRAKAWYQDKLGLAPIEERPGGALYSGPGWEFELYTSGGASIGAFTQMGIEVDDLRAAVADMRDAGVVFEEYDLPGLKTIDGIAEMSPGYASRNQGNTHGAWFKDSEGNMIGILARHP